MTTSDMKAFVLGVGAQKGGTTWLHDYLAQSPYADFGPMKEYHVFDQLDLIPAGKRVATEQKLKRKAKPDSNGGLRLQLRASTEAYGDYFAGLLAKESIRATGDVTPAYAGLSATRFTEIREAFDQRGIRTKTIFLMRDPIERSWSAVRMAMRSPGYSQVRGQQLAGLSDGEVLQKAYLHPIAAGPSAYHKTAAVLDGAFASEDIFYGFYERLFTPETTEAICDFVGLPYIDPKFDHKVNSSPKTTDLPIDIARQVATAYAPAYRFAADRFGVDFIREIWPHAHLVDL